MEKIMNLKKQVNLLKISLFVSIIAISFLLYRQFSQNQTTVQPIITNNSQPISSVGNNANSTQRASNWADQWGTNGRFQELQEQMDLLMNGMMPGKSIFSQHGFGLSEFSPVVNMNETDDEYEVKVTIPEGQEMEFNAEINNGSLQVFGKAKSIKESQTEYNTQKSFSSSQFSQSLTLTENVDESSMTVEQNKNEFIVNIPKK
jgi:HSP20 family molecular chaperone IbpA